MIRYDRVTAEWVLGFGRHPSWSLSAAAGAPSMVLGSLGAAAGGWLAVLGGTLFLAGAAVFVVTLFTSWRSGPSGSP